MSFEISELMVQLSEVGDYRAAECAKGSTKEEKPICVPGSTKEPKPKEPICVPGSTKAPQPKEAPICVPGSTKATPDIICTTASTKALREATVVGAAGNIDGDLEAVRAQLKEKLAAA
jgi:hypothetical protein